MRVMGGFFLGWDKGKGRRRGGNCQWSCEEIKFFLSFFWLYGTVHESKK